MEEIIKEVKKRSPKEVIESEKEPRYEQVYIKFPGEEMVPVSRKRSEYNIKINRRKIRRLVREHKGKEYVMIHTHPRTLETRPLPSTLKEFEKYLREGFEDIIPPSSHDFKNFLMDNKAKGMVIAQQDSESGKAEGYFDFRKTKETKPIMDISFRGLLRSLFRKDVHEKDNINYLKKIIKNCEEYKSTLNYSPIEAMQNIAKEYHLNYKTLPSEGHYLNLKEGKFRKDIHKRKTLETKIASISGLLFIASITLFSSNITGFAISNLTQKTSNIIGIILFIVGIAGLFYYLNKKKIKIL